MQIDILFHILKDFNPDLWIPDEYDFKMYSMDVKDSLQML